MGTFGIRFEVLSAGANDAIHSHRFIEVHDTRKLLHHFSNLPFLSCCFVIKAPSPQREQD